MIRTLEEISNNAWPALQTILYDGWILRFANGVTKRSNSVNLLYPSTINPQEKIDFCEKLYESRSIEPCFKITEIAEPADIDHLLEKRGYLIHSRISFQVMDISTCQDDLPPAVQFVTAPNQGWIDDFIRMNEFDPGRRSTYLGIMEQLCLPKCMVSVTNGSRTIAVGLGVAEGRHVGIFDIVVDKAYRNQGFGNQVVAAILNWGRRQGTTMAYLQVLSDNFAAISLYKKMGFREAYQYWYRMKKNG